MKNKIMIGLIALLLIGTAVVVYAAEQERNAQKSVGAVKIMFK
jgi:hypothetical protein